MGKGMGKGKGMGSWLLIASAMAVVWTAADSCRGRDEGGRAKITVDVISRRNATGHRIVKVKFIPSAAGNLLNSTTCISSNFVCNRRAATLFLGNGNVNKSSQGDWFRAGHITSHNVADLIAREDKLGNGAVDFRVQQDVVVLGGDRYFHLTAYTSVLDQRVPPPGYELVPGLGWYRLHLTPLTWEEARLACEAEGAHLAVLNSQEEANALKGIFARAPDKIPHASWANFAYIGFSDATEGLYITIFGQTLEESGYAEWTTNQPDNAKSSTDPDSDCGGIVRQNGKLNDLPCREKASYFCEISL